MEFLSAGCHREALGLEGGASLEVSDGRRPALRRVYLETFQVAWG